VTRVIALSVHADEVYVTQARSAGAAGFVLIDFADVDLPAAVAQVSEGRPFVSPAVNAGSGQAGRPRGVA